MEKGAPTRSPDDGVGDLSAEITFHMYALNPSYVNKTGIKDNT